MSGILFLDRLRVEGANAVAGITWGFPAVSAFTGFCHALERKLTEDCQIEPSLFGGCAIICHHHQPLTTTHFGTHQFVQKRAPLTRQGKTAPFNEEGRMHMTVSLLIEVEQGLENYLDRMPLDVDESVTESRWFCEQVRDKATAMRLAGGQILSIDAVHFSSQAANQDSNKHDRKILTRSLPGFALVDRSELLSSHYEFCKANDEQATMLSAWLDFSNLRFRSNSEGDPDKWARVPLPEVGWFVPIMTGYQAIAPLLGPGDVNGVRDTSVPFSLVESIYGVGQWISPHRIERIRDLLWRTEYSGAGQYRLVNRYKKSIFNTEEST